MDSSTKSSPSPLMAQIRWKNPKRNITGDPHHIPSTSVQTPITPQTIRGGVTRRAEEVYEMGHPNPLTTFIYPQL